MMVTKVVSLYELLSKIEEPSMTSAKGEPKKVRDEIRKVLQKHPRITIDFSKLRSLSPSFAYEAFGLLVDEFGERLSERFDYVNDPLDLSTRIKDALDRRSKIIRPHAS